MRSWGIGYLALGLGWLAFTLAELVQRLAEGRVPLQPQATAARRIFSVAMLFWTYLCGSVLWPGSAFLYVVAKIIVRYDQEDE